MTKPTYASVTQKPCKCGYLQRAADDPSSPIVFDPELNEYNFEYPDPELNEYSFEDPSPCGDGAREGTKATLRMYHCPFCGGAAPESKRELLFAVISAKEQRRLYELLDGIKTIDEAIRVLGPPDEDGPHGVTQSHPEREGKAPTVQSFRTLNYRQLSETAEVCIVDYQKDRVHVMLRGKYIGLPRKEGGAEPGAPADRGGN